MRRASSIKLPKPGHYAVGHIFMPQDERLRAHCERVWARIIREEGLEFLGWRSVPVDNSCLSEMVKAAEPVHRQLFIGRPKAMKDQHEFERRLYLIRKVVSNALYYAYKGRDIGHYTVSPVEPHAGLQGHVPVLPGEGRTTRTCPTRASPRRMALVHQRFSTNTFPSWKLAHPYRMVAHNGEINTLRGNVNWMAARQASVSSPLFGDDISKLWPISYEGQSDTACFDNALEFLVMGGYSLAHAAMMLIPEAWAGNPLMDGKRTRLLRVPRLPDGAVGRPGRHGLHRRPPDRRHARPQRPAARALSRHQGRPGDHVVGGRRAAGRRRRTSPASGACSRARCC